MDMLGVVLRIPCISLVAFPHILVLPIKEGGASALPIDPTS
jgi:hypothetical protein